MKLEGVETTEEGKFYMGKRVAYIYKGKAERDGTKFRVVWGKIVRSHGTSGIVRAKFRRNLPPAAIGASLRVMLYPSHI